MSRKAPKHAGAAQFGPFPYWIVRDGQWARMTGSERAVFGALVAHASYPNGQCNPGQETLAREAGVSTSTVRRATRALESKRLLSAAPGRGRGIPTEYWIHIQKPVTMDEPFSPDSKPVDVKAKTSQPVVQTQSGPTRKPLRMDERVTEEQKNVEQKNNNSTQEESVAADVVATLASLGVGEPKLTQLAKIPGLTPDIIRHVWVNNDGPKVGNRVGLLIHILESDGPGFVEQVRQGIPLPDNIYGGSLEELVTGIGPEYYSDCLPSQCIPPEAIT